MKCPPDTSIDILLAADNKEWLWARELYVLGPLQSFLNLSELAKNQTVRPMLLRSTLMNNQCKSGVE